MRSFYDGIKFYGVSDLSWTINYNKSIDLLNKHNENSVYIHINEILELYNAYLVITSPGIKTDYSAPYMSKAKSIFEIIAKYFMNITDDNILTIYFEVCRNYIDDFWTLIEKFKSYERISIDTFREILYNPETSLFYILKHKKIVKCFDPMIAEFMRQSDQTARIIVGKFLEKTNRNSEDIFFPASLHCNEYEPILHKYIESENSSIGVIQLISESQNSTECPISDELRHIALKKVRHYWEKHFETNTGVSFGVGITIKDNKEIISCTEINPLEYEFTYDIKWIKNNLDYPTLLNNFIYLFEYVDLCCRSHFVSLQSQMSILEKSIGVKGKKEYPTGVAFYVENIKSSAEMQAYVDVLRKHKIRIEDLLEWFFREYLKKEFAVEGFVFNLSSQNSTTLEKCRNLLSELDGILRQYRLFVLYKTIDRELLEISSTPIKFSDLPSMINDKYAYANSKDIESEMNMLFSDQSVIAFNPKKEIDVKNFVDLVVNYEIYLSDYPEWLQRSIIWLKDRGAISINENGIININLPRVSLLKDLYKNEVVCTSYWKKKELDQLVASGDLRYSSSLFSEPEQKYLNYMLNKSEYSNGRDLRNKYIHGSNTLDEKQQYNNYITFLKILVFVIIKMNEEFCLTNPLM